MCSMLLSVNCLGEIFVPKHDITAFVLISLGCVIVIVNVDTEEVEITADEAVDYLLSWRSIGLYTFNLIFVLMTHCVT